MKVEIFIGEKTVEKLYALEKIRHTPIEHIIERIIASAMKNDEKTWQEVENKEPSIPNISQEEKELYSSEEVSDNLEAKCKQHKERHNNLY